MTTRIIVDIAQSLAGSCGAAFIAIMIRRARSTTRRQARHGIAPVTVPISCDASKFVSAIDEACAAAERLANRQEAS